MVPFYLQVIVPKSEVFIHYYYNGVVKLVLNLGRLFCTTMALPVSVYPARGNGAPERHRNSRGRATAPRPPHMAAQGRIGGRTGPSAKLGERGAPKGTVPGMGLLGPRCGGGP